MKFKLSPLCEDIINGGLALTCGCYFLMLLHLIDLEGSGISLTARASAMTEHITATLAIIVIFALMLDIHIKRNKKDKK